LSRWRPSRPGVVAGLPFGVAVGVHYCSGRCCFCELLLWPLLRGLVEQCACFWLQRLFLSFAATFTAKFVRGLLRPAACRPVRNWLRLCAEIAGPGATVATACCVRARLVVFAGRHGDCVFCDVPGVSLRLDAGRLPGAVRRRLLLALRLLLLGNSRLGFLLHR